MSKSGQAALAAAVIVSCQPLWADVTPDDVWLSWQNMALSQGAKLTAASTVTEGDTLTLTGLALSFGDKGSARMDELRLTDTGDGTVAIVAPASFPIALVLPEEADGSQVTLDLSVTAPDAQIIASGVPLSINYAKTLPRLEIAATGRNGADRVNLTLKAAEVAGKYLSEAGESGQTLTGAVSAQSLDVDVAAYGAEPRSDVDVKLSLTNLAGALDLTGLPADDAVDLDVALAAGMTFDASLSYGIGSVDVVGVDAGKPMRLAGTLGGGSMAMAMDAAKFHYEVANKAISLNLAGNDSASGGDFTFNGQVADLSNTLDINGPNWSKTDDFAAALKAGLVVAANGSLGSTNVDFAGGPADRPVRAKASLAGAKTGFTLAATQMTYETGAKAVSVTVASPDLPVPEATLDLGELVMELAMPVAKSDTPAPFTFVTKVMDLTLPEALWTLFDPALSLPRGPATLIIDTKGMATMTSDLMEDAGALEAGRADPPGLLNALDIPQILLRAAGAEITAKGGFTFDNSDTTTFDGMPLPTGSLDIRGTGLNKLIDTLVSMGVLPQDEAMQGRMMLSMFARNDMTKDEATSVLEFKDKHFFVNGAQLQ